MHGGSCCRGHQQRGTNAWGLLLPWPPTEGHREGESIWCEGALGSADRGCRRRWLWTCGGRRCWGTAAADLAEPAAPGDRADGGGGNRRRGSELGEIGGQGGKLGESETVSSPRSRFFHGKEEVGPWERTSEGNRRVEHPRLTPIRGDRCGSTLGSGKLAR
jgi:hypothetical protein